MCISITSRPPSSILDVLRSTPSVASHLWIIWIQEDPPRSSWITEAVTGRSSEPTRAEDDHILNFVSRILGITLGMNTIDILISTIIQYSNSGGISVCMQLPAFAIARTILPNYILMYNIAIQVCNSHLCCLQYCLTTAICISLDVHMYTHTCTTDAHPGQKMEGGK